MALRGLRPGQGVRYVAADISQTMLDHTMAAARARQVAAQVEPVLADVGRLPFPDAEFDLVVSFTGLHCFPDPHMAIAEMSRVLHPGGVLTGSALLNDTGLRYLPVRQVGRFAGLLGPGATSTDIEGWLAEAGFEVVRLKGLKCPSPREIAHVQPATIRDALRELDGDDVDALVQVGTNLAAVEVAAEGERWLGKPVLAINAVMSWHALRATGIEDRVFRRGRILEEH